jgi:hypothetical protein
MVGCVASIHSVVETGKGREVLFEFGEGSKGGGEGPVFSRVFWVKLVHHHPERYGYDGHPFGFQGTGGMCTGSKRLHHGEGKADSHTLDEGSTVCSSDHNMIFS